MHSMYKYCVYHIVQEILKANWAKCCTIDHIIDDENLMYPILLTMVSIQAKETPN